MKNLDAFHSAHPNLTGPSHDSIAQGILEKRIITELLTSGVVQQEDGRIRLSTHSITADPEEIKLKKKIMKACGRAGLSALHRDEILARFPSEDRAILRALKRLIDEDRLVESEGFYFASREVRQLRMRVAQAVASGSALPVNWLKHNAGLSRKHAIPLWAWLDRCGATERTSNMRRKGPRTDEYAHGE